MRVVTTSGELDTLPRFAVVACVHELPDGPPIVLVFQRGSYDNPGLGWCMPDTPGQITSARVFEFLAANALPALLRVLVDPGQP